MSKIIKRLVIFFAVAFVFSSAAIFVLLNEPFVQNYLIKYINTNYLNKNNLNLNVQTISYNLFQRTVNLEKAQLDDIGHASQESLLIAQDLGFKLNIFSSYVNNRIVLDKVTISNARINLEYNADGKLILPDVLVSKNKPDENEIGKPFTELANSIRYLPTEILINDSNIQLGLLHTNNFQKIALKQLKLNKRKKLFENSSLIEITSDLQNSEFMFPFFVHSFNLKNLDATGILYQDGRLEFSNISGKNDFINFDSTLNALLKDPIHLSKYQLNLKHSNISAKDFFELFNLNASGDIQLTGFLKGTSFTAAPQFIGHAKWQDITLDDFKLFTGQGDIRFENQILYYDNASLQTKLGGKLFASGKYQFFDDFYFENNLRAQRLPLEELLNAVRAKQDILDGMLQSDKIIAYGYLHKKITATQKDKFDIFIKGEINVTRLHLVPLKKTNPKPLPNMLVDLSIQINDKGLNFDNSVAHIKKGTIQIAKSSLIFGEHPDLSINLIGKNLNLEFLEYFITKKTSGNLNFTGVFTFNQKNPGNQFKSQIQAENGRIDNIPFTKATGNFALYNDYGEVTDLKIEIAQKGTGKILQKQEQIVNTSDTPETSDVSAETIVKPPQVIEPLQTYLNIGYLTFRYKDMYSTMNVNITGNLKSIVYALRNRIPKFFQGFDGTISNLSFTMSGYLLHTSTWKFNFNADIQPLITPRGNLSSLSINLECAAEECKQSKILFDGFDDAPDSSAVIAIYDVSFKKSNFAFQFQNVPIEFFNYTSQSLKGYLYGLGELRGTWKKPLGSVDLNVDHFELNERDVGQLRVWYESDEPTNPQFNLSAFDNQFLVSLRIPLEDNSTSKLNIRFMNFDAGRVLPPSSRWNQNLYSRINANFSLEGKWDPNFKKGMDFLKTWQGTGKFAPSELQINSANLNVYTPNEIVFKDGIMIVEKLIISSNFASITTIGNYNFIDSTIFLNSIVDINLKDLNKTFYQIKESEGRIKGEIQVTDKILHPHFSGNLSIHAKKIALRVDEPAFTDIDGYISLNDTVIEIQKLNAKKGKGTIGITGSFDFKNLEEKNFAYPITNIHVVTNNATFTLPIPIFRTLDLVLNSDLTLHGQKPPFNVTGQIEVQKLSIFRDLTCSEIFAEYKNLPKTEADISAIPFANLNINVQAFNSISIQSNCLRGRFSTAENLSIIGNTNFPLLDGGIQTENAIFSILKARFNIRKASFVFSEKYKFDPFVDIGMNARVASYDIYWDVNGRLSVAPLNLTAQPQYLPNGNPINTGAILFMITTGQLPTQDSINTLLATSSGVYSYFGSNNNFSHVLNQTLSTVTGGLFDTLSVSPAGQNGQLAVRVNASRYFSQRLTYGVSFEGGQSVSTSSAYLYYLLNRHINFTGAYSRSDVAQQTGQSINDLSGGLRFNFGSY